MRIVIAWAHHPWGAHSANPVYRWVHEGNLGSGQFHITWANPQGFGIPPEGKVFLVRCVKEPPQEVLESPDLIWYSG